MANLQGKTVVVTGGFGVLGRAVAAAAAAQHARVARVDLHPAGAPALPDGFDLGAVDITNPAQASAAINTIAAQTGGIDVLVNVAGGFIWQSFADGGPETWTRMYSVNVATTLTMTKAALPLLLTRPGARIINVGANAATRAAAGMGAYTAAKSAVARFTESLAEELAGQDITVNAVLPSIIDTPANRADMPDADFATWVQPEALADVILFLASPAARSISGALIPVTRGA